MMIERYIVYHNTKNGEERDRYDEGDEKELLADLKSMGKAYYVYDRKEDKDYTYSQFKKKLGVKDSMKIKDSKNYKINKIINGRGFEIGDAYLGVEYENGKLYAGDYTNSGITHLYSVKYDEDFDLDWNLQELYDEILSSGDFDF